MFRGLLFAGLLALRANRRNGPAAVHDRCTSVVDELYRHMLERARRRRRARDGWTG